MLVNLAMRSTMAEPPDDVAMIPTNSEPAHVTPSKNSSHAVRHEGPKPIRAISQDPPTHTV
jgi:hypothetical protein